MKRIIGTTLAFSLLGLTIFLSHTYLTQERTIFRAQPLPHNFTFSFDTPFEEIFIHRADGGVVNALHFKAKDPKGLVIYYHGRGKNLATLWGKRAPTFLEPGFDVVMMDYRGVGKSRGVRNQTTLLGDAEALYLYMKDKTPNLPIVLYGCSFGTGVASYIASKHPTDLLLLESPYYSLVDLATHIKPYLPKSVLKVMSRYPMPTCEWIESITCDTRIFHSNEDTIIPYASSLKLIEQAATAPTLYTLTDIGHNNLTDSEKYQEILENILRNF